MYYAILGSHPLLSLAEIHAGFGDKLKNPAWEGQFYFFDLENRHQLPEMQAALGGSISFGEIIGEIALNELTKAELAKLLIKNITASPGDKRLNFSFNAYFTSPKLKNFYTDNVKNLALSMKTELKAAGVNSRFVESKTPALSSVIVSTNGLLPPGYAFVLIEEGQKLRLGRTLSVQSFKEWSKRDYGRPDRDAKAGMLPPKLARMMVNLAGQPQKDDVLLDPFAGSGTVLMEAALLGYKKLLGSDLSEKACQDTEKNLAWLKQQKPELDFLATCQAIDVRELTPDLQPTKIVTETLLGPAQRSFVTAERARQLEKQLLPLYETAFLKLFNILAPGGVCVAAFPAFPSPQGEVHYFPLAKLLQKIGFIIKSPLPANLSRQARGLTPSRGLLYARAGQMVGREILVMRKNLHLPDI